MFDYIIMKEGPLDMVFHSAVYAVILYLFMRYLLGQSNEKALARSVLFGSLAVSYMVVFGHRLPGSINHNLI